MRVYPALRVARGRLAAAVTACQLVLGVVACSHDPIASTIGSMPKATALVLSPPSVSVDTGATVQLQFAISWSDSASHSANVTFAATGGTVSDSGLYHAGSVAGVFRVIATCVCGVADTANITITASLGPGSVPPPPAAMAQLVIQISGLPGNITAQIVVSGPGGFSRAVSASGVLDSLVPGSYVVHGGAVNVGSDIYLASPDSQSVALNGGDQQTRQVAYLHTSTSQLPPHPRVWMDSDRVTKLKAQVAANSIRWQRVKTGADAQVAKGTRYNSGDENLLPDLCLAYLGTGQQSYATRAGTIITAYAVDANDITGDSGYGFRFNLPLVTMGLDWCYGGLTPGQRHQAATWLMNRADWVWPASNPSRTNAHGTNDPSNNYYWGFMMTGPAALAAMGDDTLIGPISGSNRPAYHLQLALQQWSMVAQPYLDGPGVGGAWNEGTNYDQAWRIGSFADAFLTARLPLNDPWFTAALQWHMQSTMPGGVYKAPLGNQPRVSTATEYSYDRYAVLHLLGPAHPDAALLSQLHYWLDWIGQEPVNEFNGTAMVALELIYYDPSVIPAADLSALPKAFLGQGAGEFVYRTSWTAPDATVMVFQSGPVDSGNLDNNGLMIWKGQFWITATAQLYSYSGVGSPSSYDNTMTVGGESQKLGPGANGGEIISSQVSDQLVVTRGQAKMAYGYDELPWASVRPVTSYLRTVAYLPQQDVFVVVDDASVKDSTATKVWRWQMKDAPQVLGNTFVLHSPSGDNRCFGSVLAPSTAVLGTETFALGSTPGQTTSQAVTVTLPVPQSRDIMVTVLQCGPGSTPSYVTSASLDANQATVTVGGSVVVVPFDPQQQVTLH